MRGEYLEFTDSTKLREGLPPHTWGILDFWCLCLAILGITPTHVGNTRQLFETNQSVQDYPHTRGEYTKQTPLHRHYEN